MTVCFMACRKEHSNSSTQQDQEEFAAVIAESDAEAESIFNDVFDNVIGVNDDVGINGVGIYNASSSTNTQCFTVITSHLSTSSFFPIRIVLDFGMGCVGIDGKTRKGKVITEYSNRLLIAGALAATRFEGYMVNDLKIEGTHSVINNSTTTFPSFQINVSGKLSSSNGNFTEWYSEKTISKVDGNLDLLTFDDAFKVTGFASGSVRKNDRFFQWSTNISEPLVKRFNCRWLVKGVVTIKKGALEIAILDYGSGQCDAKASFTVLGRTREISLH